MRKIRLYKVYAFDRDSGLIHNARSVFADLQKAIDKAWSWYDEGYSARVVNRASNKIECQILHFKQGSNLHVKESD